MIRPLFSGVILGLLLGLFGTSLAWSQPLCSSLPTNFTISNLNPCAQTPVTFTAAATNALSYQWTFSNGIAAAGNGQSLVRTFPALGIGYPVTVTLTLGGVDTLGNACTVTSTQTFTTQATPALTVLDTSGSKNFKACVPSLAITQVTKGFSIAGGVGPYTWNFGDGTPPVVSPAGFQQHTYTNFGTFPLVVTDNSAPCQASFTANVAFFGNDLNANMNVVGNINICEGQSVLVNNGTDTINQIIERYIWNWGNGDIDTVLNTAQKLYTFTYDDDVVCDSLLNAQGNFQESIRLTIENGCATHYNESPVFVKPLPRPKITGPGLGCRNTLITFSNAESCPLNPDILYTWIWGDGTTNFGPSPLVGGIFHAYADTGEFTIRLIASLSSCNFVDTVTHKIRILEAPIAQFVADPNFGCAPLAVDVINSSYPKFALQYQWNVFGGGFAYLDSTEATDGQPRFQLQDSGLYIIQLTVTNICGTSFMYDTVQVARPPVITLAPIPDTCGFWNYVPTVAYNDNGNPISNYTWNFGAGTPGTSNQAFPPGPIFFPPGSHNVSVTVTNICGTKTATRSFVVDTPATNVFAGNDFVLCNNIDSLLQGQPAGGIWTGIGVNANGLFSQATPGTYSLEYAVGTGNCRVADTVTITVTAAPTVQILPPAATVFCQGDPQIVLIADTGSALLDTFAIFTPLIPTLPGDSLLIYQFTALNGCAGRDSILLQVNPLPAVLTTDTTYCQDPSVVQLVGYGPTVGGTGTWTGAGIVNGAAGTFLPANIGTFPLVYSFSDLNGCVNQDTMTVIVVAGDSAVAGPDLTLCQNADVVTLAQFSPAGGSFSGLGVLPGSNQYNPLLGNIGANPVIYSYGAGSCFTTDTLFVVIQDTLPLNAGPDLVLCEGDLPFILTGATAAGDWLPSLGLVNPATGLFDPGLIAPNGSDTVYRELFSPAGCRSEDARIIQVDDKPIADFLIDSVVCTGDVVVPGPMSVGANGFTWDFGDGFTTTLASPSHTYADTGIFVVTFYVSDQVGCKDTAQANIRITESPIPAFVMSTSQGCAPLPVTFTDLSIRNGGTYFWDFGNGQTFQGALPPPITFEQGLDDTVYVVTLTLTNDCGSVSIQDSITVFPKPIVIFGTQVSNGCSPLLIAYNNVSSGNPTSFVWDLGQGGPLQADSIPQPRYYLADSLDSLYTITLIAINQCGADTGSTQITVYPNDLTPFFNTSQTVGCAPLTVTFTDFSGAPFVAWDYGQGLGNQDVGNHQPTHVFAQAGSYLVKMYSDNGCSKDTGEITITVYPAVPSNVPAPAPVCAGEPMSFSPGNTQGIGGYFWEFGDGATSTQTNPSHLYPGPGTYQVRLTTFSTIYQCPATDSANVLVRVLPSPALSQNPVAGCEPFTISPLALTPGLSYLWEFGLNNDQAVGNSPNYTYSQAGLYNLLLRVTDAFGCENDSSIGITVHPRPQSDFTINQDTLCGPNLVLFSNQSTIPTGSLWRFGTGNPADVSNNVNAQFFYSIPGTYQVSLESETTFGCRDTAYGMVHIYPQPVAHIVPSVTAGCVPLVVQFQNSSVGSSRSQWVWGDGTPGSSLFQPGSHTFFAPDDSFLVQLFVDTAGHCFDTASVWIRTASWPVAAFTQDVDRGCGQETVTFSNSSSSLVLPLSFEWDFGNATISTLRDPLPVTYTQPASYPVRLIVTNSYQCQDTAFGEFTLLPQPEARFGMSDSTICAPQAVQFTNQSTGFGRSQWRFGDGFTSSTTNPIHNFFFEDTTIWITLVVDTAGLCVDSTRRRLRTSSYPVALFRPSETQFCGDATVNFTNLSQTRNLPLVYGWNFGNGLSSTLRQPSTYYVVGDVPISFEPRLIATNSFGCADTTSETIVGLPQPNAAFLPIYAGNCSPLEVRFLNLSTGFNQSAWQFSNGARSDSTSPIQFFGVGEWDVDLVVSWDGQCWDSLTSLREIEVVQSAIAGFTSNTQTTAIPDGTVAFTNQSRFANNYTWIFGDGELSTDENPIHRYFSNGPFDVTLIANNNANCPDTSTALDFRPLQFGGIHVPNAMAPGSGVDSADVFLPVGAGLCFYRVDVFDIWGNLVWYSEELRDGRPSESWDGTITNPAGVQRGGPITDGDVFLWQLRYKLIGDCDSNTRPRIQKGTLTVIR